MAQYSTLPKNNILKIFITDAAEKINNREASNLFFSKIVTI